jgi:hypothetical protein
VKVTLLDAAQDTRLGYSYINVVDESEYLTLYCICLFADLHCCHSLHPCDISQLLSPLTALVSKMSENRCGAPLIGEKVRANIAFQDSANIYIIVQLQKERVRTSVNHLVLVS